MEKKKKSWSEWTSANICGFFNKKNSIFFVCTPGQIFIHPLKPDPLRPQTERAGGWRHLS